MNVKGLLELIFSEYWGQVVLIISAVAALIFYFIKRKFDLESKKREVNHNISQKNALDSISQYLDAYTALSCHWVALTSEKIFHKKIEDNDFRNLINNRMIKLHSSFLYAHLFFDDSVSDILHNLLIIQSEISRELDIFLFQIEQGEDIQTSFRSFHGYVIDKNMKSDIYLRNLKNELKELFK